MNNKVLQDILKQYPDNTEIFVHNVINPCGNISELGQVELSTYGSFGESIPCIILKSDKEE